MKLNQPARDLIGEGANATIVTVNPSGTPNVSVVWVALDSTPQGDDILTAHLGEHIKGPQYAAQRAGSADHRRPV
jgi:hypothetical protein